MTPIMITNQQAIFLMILIGFMVFAYIITRVGYNKEYVKQNRYKRDFLEEVRDIKVELMYCPTLIDICSVEGWINTLEIKYRGLMSREDGRFLEEQINELYKCSNERRQQLRKYLQTSNQN